MVERRLSRIWGSRRRGREEDEKRRRKYQSMDCGGSSFEGEVLTVSTQPGMGSFPWRLRKAEYAEMNLCACIAPNAFISKRSK